MLMLASCNGDVYWCNGILIYIKRPRFAADRVHDEPIAINLLPQCATKRTVNIFPSPKPQSRYTIEHLQFHNLKSFCNKFSNNLCCILYFDPETIIVNF